MEGGGREELISQLEMSNQIITQFRGIDLMKFVAALMVVGIHTWFPYEIDVLFRWAVPFFFIASSFLFFYKKKTYKDFAKRLCILYCVWFVIEIPFVLQRFADAGWCAFIRGLIFSNTFFASWYLTALLEAVGLCVLLSRWLSNQMLFIIGLVLYCVALAGGGYYGLLPEYYQSILQSIDHVIPVTNSFIPAFIFIVLGKIVSDHYEERDESSHRLVLLIVICAIAYVAETIILKPYHRYTDTFLCLPILAWLLLLLATRISPKLSADTCSFMRKASILVYLMHGVIIKLLSSISFGNTAFSLVLSYACTVIISLAISSLIIFGAKRWKVLTYLY